jgi:mRNA-degrading endonuclease toxin of MazEF toxin-antitoxin module
MPSYSRGDIVLVRYPFSDLSGAKVRPAAVVNAAHESGDLIFVPLTSRTSGLRSGEFLLSDFHGAGLNVPTAAKRGVHTLESRFVLQHVGHLMPLDLAELDRALAYWLGLKLVP